MTLRRNNSDLVLGIDAGGTTAKAALFDLDGRLVSLSRCPLPTSASRGGGRAERDADAMWSAVVRTIRDLVDGLPDARPQRVAAVAVTGFGGGLFAVDRQGNALGPGIMSSDSRAISQAEDLNAGRFAAAIAETLGIRLWAPWALPLFRWLDQNDDPLRHADKVLWCKDFIRLRLTGQIATDPTDAATAGLLDLSTGQYADDLVAATGSGHWRGKLPEILPGSAIAGHVTASAAGQTGLLAGTPVIAGAMDISLCALASGVIHPGAVSMIAGTWSINQVVVKSGEPVPELPLTALPHLLPGQRLISYNSARSAGNLSWVFSQMMTQPDRMGLPADHLAFDRLAQPALLDQSTPSFFPYLLGGPNGARAAFLGLGLEHDLPELVTAMYEGVAFSHLADSAPLWTLVKPDQPIRLAGGASSSPAWVQIFADSFFRPVETLDCQEIGAKGCAILAATAIGAYPDPEAAALHMSRVLARAEPEPGRADLMQYRFRRWQADADWLAHRQA